MMGLIGLIISRTIAFLATNIGNLSILILFFTTVQRPFRFYQVFLGQYFAFLVLILFCLPGFWLGFVLPKPVIGLFGLLLIGIGISQLLKNLRDEETLKTSYFQVQRSHRFNLLLRILKVLCPARLYQVILITFANTKVGIGIYGSLFAGSTVEEFQTSLVILGIWVGLWVLFGVYLSRRPAIAQSVIEKFKLISPFALIGLGIYTLLADEAYSVFFMTAPT